MKAIAILTLILGAAIISTAQEPKTEKTFQQKKFKTDTSEIKILPFQKLPDDLFTQNNQGKNDFFANHQKPEFRMPVAGGKLFHSNMPISVPDSTVTYYIKTNGSILSIRW